MKIKKLGIPYMGSKRGIANKLVNYIIKHNPNIKYVYDLFGGGGAMTFEFAQRPQIEKVFYNELNKGVVSLLKDILENSLTDKYYKWIDRETFHKHKLDDDWFGGLIKTCWSFGNNNQKGYMYGKNIEEKKRLLHEYIVNKDEDCKQKFEQLFNIKIDSSCINADTVNERRLQIQKYLRKTVENKEIFKGFCVCDDRIYNIAQHLQQVQQLKQIEHLQRIQQLKKIFNIDNLILSNLSYENVEIETPVDETIIYLDPPYKNTGKYQENIKHNELYEFFKNHKYKIYMSSYDAPFEPVFSIKKRQLLSATNNSKYISENLYCNKEEYKYLNTDLFNL